MQTANSDCILIDKNHNCGCGRDLNFVPGSESILNSLFMDSLTYVLVRALVK